MRNNSGISQNKSGDIGEIRTEVHIDQSKICEINLFEKVIYSNALVESDRL